MSTTSGSRDYGRFDELAEEFAERFRRGERPSLQEYVDRLPEMAEEIRGMFPALVEVERADGDARVEVRQPPPPAIARLREIGDYRILREVGRGGMGVVYEAEQISLGRRVALKVLPAHAVGDRMAMERFRREAKAAARMHHTNIVPVFEVGRDGEFAFYAMQLIEGQGLDQVIDELKRLHAPGRRPVDHGPESPGSLTGVTRAQVPGSMINRGRDLGRIAESLLGGRMVTEVPGSPPAGSPATGGLDRTEAFEPDSPSGLATEGDGEGRPPDHPAADASSSAVLPGGKHVSEVNTSGRRQPFFQSVAQIGRQAAQGLAHAHSRGIVHRDIKPSNLLLDTDGVVWITDFGLAKADDDGLTQTGDILGTLRYMSPERFRGQGDARADLYALGMTLYELLTLRPAYDASDRLKLIEQIKNQEPPRPRSIDVRIPRDLETIVLKAMEKDPESRYATAGAMAEDLRRFLADEPIQARRVSASERYWRWARRNPAIATLGGVLTAVLVLVTLASLLVAGRFANLAEREGISAAAERTSRFEAVEARRTADQARKAAEAAGAAAQAEAYRAMLSEVKALRAGHQPGWRDDAMGNLARLSTMGTPRRDLVELRSEAVASLGEFDIVEVAQLEGFRGTVWSLDFSPDSQVLATATINGDLHLWDVPRRQHSWQLDDPAGKEAPTGWPPAGGPTIRIRFLPDGGLVRTTWSRRVEFLDASGRPSARPPILGGTAQAVGLEIDRRGHWLAVGWDDGRIDLHDTATGAARRSIKGSSRTFALSPDGRWLALLGPNHTVQIWPIDDDSPPITLGSHNGEITSLAFSPDGAILASTSLDQTARLWDVAGRTERVTLRGHKEKLVALAFSPDGNWVATTSHDYTTRIWDARTGQTLAVLPGTWFMQSVAFSPDGRYLAVSAVNGTGRLYQIHGRRERRWLTGHVNGTNSLSFHPRVARLASAADDHAIMVWDMESARPLQRWRESDTGLNCVAYSSDGALLASGGGKGEIRLWDAEIGSLLRVLVGHEAGIRAVTFDPAGGRLATGDASGFLIVWDIATGQILRREQVGPSWIWSIGFVDGGRRLVTEVSFGPLVLYDLEGTDPPRRVAVPGGMRRFVFDRTRNDLIVAGTGGTLTRVSLPDLALGHHLDRGHDGAIESLALSPSGRLLATGGGTDRRIILRDATTFEPLVTLPGWTGMVKDLAFDPTGRWLAIAGADSDVGLWDLGLVRNELAAVGLAWDQPAPAVASAGSLAALIQTSQIPVPIVWVGNIDPAEYNKARELIDTGVAAFRKGRHADAVADLQQASERLVTLRNSHPGDPKLASQHGISLGFLATALADLKRPGEALARSREALAAYGSMTAPQPNDLYNMACVCAMISALDDRGSTHEREKLQVRALGYLRGAIAADQNTFLPLVRTDHDLDPLRNRADFRDLMADVGFPRDPFGEPSPLSRSVPETLGAGGGNTSLASKDEGHALLAAGLTRRGLPVLASALANDPGDMGLLLEVVTLQAWFGQDAQLDATCRMALEFARDTANPSTADITAKLCCLRPSDDREVLDPTLALARRAVELGKDHPYLPYFRMALGMAEYRSGNHAAADAALLAASKAERGNPVISGTTAFYRVMSLYRQGKQAEARRIATDALLQMRPLPADEDNPLTGGASADDLILWMASKEARALLNLDAAQAPRSKPAGP